MLPTAGEQITPRRYLALHLPRLATDRVRRAGLVPPDRPVAIWAQQGSRRLLTAVDAMAEAADVQAGGTLADTEAICPTLVLHPADPAADAALLGHLAVWALRFTPLVALDGSDGLTLDVTGATDLAGGDSALLRDATARLHRVGYTAWAALAGTPDAAGALARAGRHGTIVPVGRDRAALDPLPLSTLRLEPGQVSLLGHLGLRRIGDVLRQPRSALAARFGADLLATLDAATGEQGRPRALHPVRPPPDLAAARDLAGPIMTREVIDPLIDVLLTELCGTLLATGRGARSLRLLASRTDGTVQELTIGTGTPTRDPAHLRRLLAERLEQLAPGFGFERFALRAEVTVPLLGAQSALPGARPTSGEGDGELARLLDRLAQRLDIWRLAPRASHWPEHAVARVSAFDPVVTPPGPPSRPRPMRLLRRPVPLSVMAAVPDSPPMLLRFGADGRGTPHRVRRAEGPERLEPEWWQESPTRLFRDYYRIELVSGARLWVCRVGPMRPQAGWFLHGLAP